MLKKSSLIFTCNNLNNLHPLQTTGPISNTSCSQQHHSRVLRQQRPYAVVSDGSSRHNHGELRWPEVTSANTIPTPYQIFNQKKNSPYSKKRFYELVKLYHPDRHDMHFAKDDLSYAIKLERYRLVVAANDILSDPVKRSAFDTYGAGWNGMPDVTRPRDSSDPSSPWASHGGRGWGGGPHGPSQNATWEDWERWYARDANGPQEPRFVSNSAFVGLIIMFAVVGGVGQATRVGNYSMSFIEQRDALHNSVSKDLIRRRKETTTKFSSREERIREFLKQRDPVGYGVVDPKEETYRRLLPPPEICSSEDIKDRKMDVYREGRDPKNG